ncbi:hypothetical protein OJAV_G00221150 [Oryzias javanicus]|uniref:Uncharacterized protein n=1 Tax=Oryzias javanicus TaxID=123683 RepID=A0A3S2NTZ4_ORYJA|nr:hypothetical protein OJAV_G00221150 [Oryzias javanicus]
MCAHHLLGAHILPEARCRRHIKLSEEKKDISSQTVISPSWMPAHEFSRVVKTNKPCIKNHRAHASSSRVLQ